MDPNKLVTHHHKPAPDSTRKPKAPPVVTATRAGLHPMSKTVQGLVGHHKKKG